MHPSPPPNILRSSVVGCARKYEQSKKRCHKGILFSEIVVFLVRKGLYTTFNIVKYGKSGKRNGKSEKPGRCLKKVIRNFGREKWNFFQKKTSLRNLGPRKILSFIHSFTAHIY